MHLASQLPGEAVPELVSLSDELNINELYCVELWMQVIRRFDFSWRGFLCYFD